MNNRKVLLSALIAMAASLGATAHAADEHAMVGCLNKGPDDGTFVLAGVEGPVNTAVLAGSTVDLGPHLGHKVEITGSTVADAQPHTMMVTAMKHLAASCP